MRDGHRQGRLSRQVRIPEVFIPTRDVFEHSFAPLLVVRVLVEFRHILASRYDRLDDFYLSRGKSILPQLNTLNSRKGDRT